MLGLAALWIPDTRMPAQASASRQLDTPDVQDGGGIAK